MNAKLVIGCTVALAPAVAASSCASSDALPVYGDGEAGDTDSPPGEPATIAESPPPPITGGTMLITESGDRVIIADPARDFVYVVDAQQMEVEHSIPMQVGDRPSRMAEDGAGRLHVVARGSDNLVTVDLETGAILARRASCAEPRGIAFDPLDDALWVACSTGQLQEFPSAGGPPLARIEAPADLRDVLVDEDGLRISRFRDADVLRMDRSGFVETTEGPATLQGALVEGRFERRMPGVAWRTRPLPDGGWLMFHQRPSDAPLGPKMRPDTPDKYYAIMSPCRGPTNSSVTLRKEDGTIMSTLGLEGATLVVDGTISPSGRTLAFVSASTKNGENLHLVDVGSLSDQADAECVLPSTINMFGQLTSVEFADDDTLWVFNREPAAVTRYEISTGTRHAISLHRDTIEDTGHDLFHLDPGGGMACASCHPEGEQDGLVRVFTELGLRRTQSLRVGLADTAPYHWAGEFESVHELMDQVHVRRMGAAPRPDDHYEALERWLFALPPPRHHRPSDDVDAVAGRAVFERVGCIACHDGPALTNNLTWGAETGTPLQIPSLRGLSSHPPYMHDGRAANLQDAVLDMLSWSAHPDASPEDVALMVAYLESL